MIQMKKVALEILISTMNRTDLSFLEPMFPHRDLADFHLLIINQTTPGSVLESSQDHIRVINSYETGLSKSRNLAVKHTIGEVALIADDDIEYLNGFAEEVTKAFRKHTDAALISFQFFAKGKDPQKKYIDRERKVESLIGEPDLSSWEIALKPDKCRENGILFNEYFGLGANFPSGEETLLLNEVLKQKFAAYHVPTFIGRHVEESTGTIQNNENHIRGISALKYLKYGKWAPLSLLRFIYISVMRKRISPEKIGWAYRVGSQAIKECKMIYKTQQNPFQ